MSVVHCNYSKNTGKHERKYSTQRILGHPFLVDKCVVTECEKSHLNPEGNKSLGGARSEVLNASSPKTLRKPMFSRKPWFSRRKSRFSW